MLSAQLNELEQRCYKAIQKGHLIGKGENLAALLMAECGEVEAIQHSVGSPEHLLKLIQAVKDVRSGKAKKALAKKAEPIKAEPIKAEPVKAVEDKLDGEAIMAVEAEEPVVDADPVELEPEKGKKGKSKKGN